MKPSETCENCEALTAELELLRKRDRTDEALARQLGRSIEKNARLQVAIAQGRIEIEQMMQTEPNAAPVLARVLEIMKRF
jgi:hypothetical protein